MNLTPKSPLHRSGMIYHATTPTRKTGFLRFLHGVVGATHWVVPHGRAEARPYRGVMRFKTPISSSAV